MTVWTASDSFKASAAIIYQVGSCGVNHGPGKRWEGVQYRCSWCRPYFAFFEEDIP